MARRPGVAPNRSVRRSNYQDVSLITTPGLRAALDQAHVRGRAELYNEAIRRLRVDEDSEEDVQLWLEGALS